MSAGKFEKLLLSERENMERIGNDLGAKIIDELIQQAHLSLDHLNYTCRAPIKHTKIPTVCGRPLSRGICQIHGKLSGDLNSPSHLETLRDQQFEYYYTKWESQKFTMTDSAHSGKTREDCKQCMNGKFCQKHTIGYSIVLDSIRSSMNSSGNFDDNLLDIVQEYITVDCNLVVSFKVEGTSHCGWCTDAENEEFEPYTMKKTINIRTALSQKFNDPNFMRALNYQNSGCTTGGSGMCEGEAFQTYTCIKCFPVRINSIIEN